MSTLENDIIFRELAFPQSCVSTQATNSFFLCSKQKLLNTTKPNTTLSTRQTKPYSTTSSMLSASPFRLTSTPKKHENEHRSEADAEAEAAAAAEEEETEGYYSPYKPKRQWPPDMSKLSPKHQFRLERKYRRRAALKYARPGWVKATKLVQWGVIICLSLLSLFFGSARTVLLKSIIDGVFSCGDLFGAIYGVG